MGMDVAFNREQAIAAGLQLTTEINGEAVDIQQAEDAVENGFEDPAFLRWLKTEESVVLVPGTEFCVVDNGFNDGDIVVRANRWGRIHEPLTLWLSTHNIDWREF